MLVDVAPHLETELLAFPTGRHDDQVDTLAYAAAVAVQTYAGSWDGAWGIQRCSCGTTWSDIDHKQCPGCGCPPEQPQLTVLEGTADPEESYHPPLSKPDPMEQLAALRAFAGRRF